MSFLLRSRSHSVLESDKPALSENTGQGQGVASQPPAPEKTCADFRRQEVIRTEFSPSLGKEEKEKKQNKI